MTTLIPMPSPEATTVLNQIVAMCRTGYATADRTRYAEIIKRLATIEQTDEVTEMLRLAEEGTSLSSPRFAFPHIEDRALDIIHAKVG